MRVLLTGADGFTGRHFSAIAASHGHEVVKLRANLLDKTALTAEILKTEPEAVVHLAAISFVGSMDVSAIYAVNVLGTTNLLDALLSLTVKPRKVLLASTANIYGNCDVLPIDEMQVPAPVNHYAASKLAMEHMARTYAVNLPLVIARPFNYTGTGQSHDFIIPKIVKHFAHRIPVIELGNLRVEREFNDVQMVCSTYLQLLQHAIPGEIYNVCTGKPHSLHDVIDTLLKITGHQIEVKVNPSFVRVNEVHCLCGNPDKLKDLLEANNVTWVNPSLEDTLRGMLDGFLLGY